MKLRCGHTLLELVVALGLGAIVMAALYVNRFGSGGVQSAASDAVGLADLQGRVRQLVVEVQEATRVFYPMPGAGAKDGLGLVNIDGQTVLYHLEPVPGETVFRLVRLNLNEFRKSRKAPETPFLENVVAVSFDVAPAEPGKEASLVRIDLSVGTSSKTSEAPTVIRYLTSAFPRNLERRVPDDVLVAGSPLTPIR